MDEILMLDWIRNSCRQHTQRQSSFLIMDSFRARLTPGVTEEVRKAGGVTAVIPGGCTGKIQPLDHVDVSINKPFKTILRGKWIKYIQDEVARLQAEKSQDKVKPPSKQLIVDWVVAACRGISNKKDMVSMVRRLFVIIGIAAKLSGSVDHLSPPCKEGYRKG